MSSVAGSQFVQALLKSGLLTEEQFASALAQHRGRHGGRENHDALPGELLASGVITAWQYKMLSRGASRGFFLGKHKLLNRIGSGGMSVVYLAEHVALQRRVAIKVLDQKRSSNPSHLARFYRESRVTAALDHPNIVRVYDFDQFGDHHYLVMEFIDGFNLQDFTDQRGPLAADVAAYYTKQAAAGLAVAHDAGLIHRDVKPANLLVNSHGVVKVTDLGLARTECGENLKLTLDDGGMLGTVDYISPEQAIDSHHVTAHSDVYSLGCTLYFMLTGQPPFPGGSLATKLMHHQIKRPPSISAQRDDVPASLIEICDAMLAKKPADRPSAAELARTLDYWLQRSGSPLSPSEGSFVPAPRPRPAEDTIAAAQGGTVCHAPGDSTSVSVDIALGDSSSINLTAPSSIGGGSNAGLKSDNRVRIRMTCTRCHASVLTPIGPDGSAAPCLHCGGPLATSATGAARTAATTASASFPGFGLPESK